MSRIIDPPTTNHCCKSNFFVQKTKCLNPSIIILSAFLEQSENSVLIPFYYASLWTFVSTLFRGPSQTAQTLRMHRVASQQSFENAEAASQVAEARAAKFNLQRSASRLLRESDLVRV